LAVIGIRQHGNELGVSPPSPRKIQQTECSGFLSVKKSFEHSTSRRNKKNADSGLKLIENGFESNRQGQSNKSQLVIPAKAGIQKRIPQNLWMPDQVRHDMLLVIPAKDCIQKRIP